MCGKIQSHSPASATVATSFCLVSLRIWSMTRDARSSHIICLHESQEAARDQRPAARTRCQLNIASKRVVTSVLRGSVCSGDKEEIRIWIWRETLECERCVGGRSERARNYGVSRCICKRTAAQSVGDELPPVEPLLWWCVAPGIPGLGIAVCGCRKVPSPSSCGCGV